MIRITEPPPEHERARVPGVWTMGAYRNGRQTALMMWTDDDGLFVKDASVHDPMALARMLMVFRQRYAGRPVDFVTTTENPEMMRLVGLLEAEEIGRIFRAVLPEMKGTIHG